MMSVVVPLLATAFAQAKPPPPPKDPWAPLRQALDGWQFTDNFAVTVGNASGPLFHYTHGNFTLRTNVLTASTSKWPLAMMMVGLVQDGTIGSLDDLASKYVPWWSKDPKDLKSTITLRHLLSFTSAFGGGVPGQENTTKTCMDSNATTDYLACARQIYELTNLSGTPGYDYSYNSIHLQLAGAVAVQASGLDIQGVLRKYLFAPYGMVDSSCAQPSARVPQLAVCLNTTAADYERFLLQTLRHGVLSRELVEQSEKDYTPFLRPYYTLYGLYAFGHFIECFDAINGFTKECEAAQVHCDPGAFGFYPLIDRKRGYYMQVVAYEATTISYPRSGIPEYLRLATKPLVDQVIDGVDISATASHHTPAQLGLTLSDINYIADCYLHPEHCA